jgi:hypothetical protein
MFIQPNPCNPTWFTHPHESVLKSERPDLGMDPPADPVDSVLISPPEPQEVRLPRDPFKPPARTDGQLAARLAYSVKGRRSASLKGQLKGFQAAGGQTNNCADFVSSIEQKAGRLKGHYVSVPRLEQGLRAEGWVPIQGSQSKPGDVWTNGSHAEIVAAPGGTRLIGSNNGGNSYQTITDHPQDPSQGRYWGRR